MFSGFLGSAKGTFSSSDLRSKRFSVLGHVGAMPRTSQNRGRQALAPDAAQVCAGAHRMGVLLLRVPSFLVVSKRKTTKQGSPHKRQSTSMVPVAKAPSSAVPCEKTSLNTGDAASAGFLF